MRKERSFLLIALLLPIISAYILHASEKAGSYIIKGVKYYPMLDGYCAMTALRMNLRYYGVEVEPSLLLNLGWDYGFVYIQTPFYTVAYPDTDPVEEIVYASHLLGFKAKVLIHKSLEKAKNSLVKYISFHKPVLVQWIPHTVLAYGYKENGNRIIYHDPGSPTNNIMAFSLSTRQIEKGEAAQMNIAEWVKMPFLWKTRQFQMVVVQPDDKKIKIDWKKIWKRNAEKTLGFIKNPYPAHYGISGIKEMIKGLKSASFQDSKKLSRLLARYEITFKLGVGFRRDAAAFLAGQASLSKDNNLSHASLAFLESAHLFREGMNLINYWLKNHPQQAEDARKALIEILEKVVDSEQRGAHFLLEASK